MRIAAIYDADGGILGEARYVVAKVLGRGSCSLCDISHGHGARAKPAWRELASELGPSFEVLHRNEAASVPWSSLGRLPIVVGEDHDGWRVLVDAEALERCDGDVERFGSLLRAALA